MSGANLQARVIMGVNWSAIREGKNRWGTGPTVWTRARGDGLGGTVKVRKERASAKGQYCEGEEKPGVEGEGSGKAMSARVCD